MTISLEVNRTLKVGRLNRLSPLHYGFKLWVRFWWHTKAYSTIFSVMILVLISLLVVLLHTEFNQLSQKFRLQAIKLQQFKTARSSTKIPFSK